MCFSASYAARKTRRKTETPLETRHETDRNCPNYSRYKFVKMRYEISEYLSFSSELKLYLMNVRRSAMLTWSNIR